MANKNDDDIKTLDSKKTEDVNTEVDKEKEAGKSETPGAQSTSPNNEENDFDNVSSLKKFLDEEVEPACPLKSNNDQYCHDRETAKTLMYLIDNRDRQKVSSWIKKLDQMTDEEGVLERLIYIKFLVATLSGSLGLVEPFTSMPPEKVKPLQMILPGPVYVDILKDQPEPCLRKKLYAHKPPSKLNSQFLQDKQFYEQQLFPPEGIICYAAAFSVLK